MCVLGTTIAKGDNHRVTSEGVAKFEAQRLRAAICLHTQALSAYNIEKAMRIRGGIEARGAVVGEKGHKQKRGI